MSDDLPAPRESAAEFSELETDEYRDIEREQLALQAEVEGGVAAVRDRLGLKSTKEARMLLDRAYQNFDERQMKLSRIRARHEAREEWMIEKLLPSVKGVWDEEKGQWKQSPSTNAVKAITAIHDRQAKRYDTDIEAKADRTSFTVNLVPPWQREEKKDDAEIIDHEDID